MLDEDDNFFQEKIKTTRKLHSSRRIVFNLLHSKMNTASDGNSISALINSFHFVVSLYKQTRIKTKTRGYICRT